HELALEGFSQVETMALASGNDHWRALACLGAAESQLALGDLAAAGRMAAEGRGLAFASPNLEARVWAERIMAEVEAAQDEWCKAEEHRLGALALAVEMGDKKEIGKLEAMGIRIAGKKKRTPDKEDEG
ncbi:MAG: hypothetical protein WCL50_17795, partial [Spirochaetota bacterium]